MTAPTIRAVTGTDHTLLHQLAGACPPLDVHTPYTYWVAARMWGSTSFIAAVDGFPVGFALAVANLHGTMLLWQLGVLPGWRRRGVAAALADAVLAAADYHRMKRVDVTITADNTASLATIRAAASRTGWQVTRGGRMSVTVNDTHHPEVIWNLRPTVAPPNTGLPRPPTGP